MTTLDVLIPHYNDPEGLMLSLRSVFRQKWVGTKRIVVADDGSTPASVKIIENIVEDFRGFSTAKRSVHIDLIRNAENRGRPYTRNVLLDAINSKYVAWLDAGDEWYPKKLSTQFDVLELSTAAHITKPIWVTCNYDWAWHNGRRRKVDQVVGQDQHKGLLSGGNLRAYLWTLLGTAESFKCVGWFDERLPRMQDLDYFIRFVSHGGEILKSNAKGTYCVYHKSDVGRNADEIRACNALIYDKHRVLFNRYGRKFCKMRLYKMEMLAARFAQNNGGNGVTVKYFWRAFKTKPIVFTKHIFKNGFNA